MEKINFENLPSTNTPLDADTLNGMQSNIEKSVVAVGETQPSTSENVWIKKGKNLFDKNNVLNGYRFGSDGMLFADSSYSASDFIKVLNSTQYTISWNIETRECVCYYDGNKTFISRNVSEKTFTTPANCEYIRASVANSSINSAQIEQGSQTTTYETYVEKEILIKNDNGVFEEFYNENNINTTIKGRAILDTSYISREEINLFVKKGNIVRFDFTVQTTGTWSNTTKFATGLPKPVQWLRFVGVDTSAGDKPVRFSINSDGEVTNWYSATTPPAGHLIEGGVTYITID